MKGVIGVGAGRIGVREEGLGRLGETGGEVGVRAIARAVEARVGGVSGGGGRVARVGTVEERR